MRKLYRPDLRESWERVKQIIEERNRKFGSITEEDVRQEVVAHRSDKGKIDRRSHV